MPIIPYLFMFNPVSLFMYVAHSSLIFFLIQERMPTNRFLHCLHPLLHSLLHLGDPVHDLAELGVDQGLKALPESVDELEEE